MTSFLSEGSAARNWALACVHPSEVHEKLMAVLNFENVKDFSVLQFRMSENLV